jgi:hypothetical protein
MSTITSQPKPAAMSGDFDARVIETGLRLYNLIEGETPSIFQKNYWMGKVMDWAMRDEAFKVELFRFVDVFPSLNNSEAVARHLREYFARPGQDFPDALQWGIKAVYALILFAARDRTLLRIIDHGGAVIARRRAPA